MLTCLLPVVLALAAESPEPGDAASAARASQDAGLRAALQDARFLQSAGRLREAAELLRQGIAAAPAVSAEVSALATATLAELGALAGEQERGDNQRNQTDRLRQAEAASWAESDARLAVRAERLARIRELRDRDLLDLALARCRQLASDWPGDQEIESQFDQLLAMAHRHRRENLAAADRELRQEVHERIQRSLLPTVAGDPAFPTDWKRRRRPADAEAASPLAERRAPAWEDVLRNRLAARIDLGITDLAFSDALAAFETASGLSLVKEPAAVASPAMVSLRARSIPAESALNWLCTQAGSSWQIIDGAVTVGSERPVPPVTQVHDIAALVAGVRDFPGRGIGFAISEGGGGIGPLGAGGDTAEGAAAPSPDAITELMRRTVSPATWQQPGCGTEIRGTALIVTAPPAVQREVAAFLATQTAAHSLAVRVELRWLELTDGFDRAIGIQWTNPGYLSQDDGGSIAATVIPTLPSLAVAAPTGGATLAFSLLGEPQLAALVSAIENSEQGRQLEAGDLVCLHGQQANIIFGKQDSFISDYEITEGLYDPVISTLWTGMTVDVRPLVSADRRYVSLELQAATASLRMDTAEFGTIRAVGFTDEEDGLLFHQTYTIELPEVAIREIGNTVMIPDRGCLLIGGFGRIIDQDASAGIPWLAGVPVVGYLFGATRTLRERSQLYLYATVRIIPYDELEARL